MEMEKDKELTQRKRNRLENYDYSSCGAYFLTICTAERRNYFWSNVGATIGRPLHKKTKRGIVINKRFLLFGNNMLSNIHLYYVINTVLFCCWGSLCWAIRTFDLSTSPTAVTLRVTGTRT